MLPTPEHVPSVGQLLIEVHMKTKDPKTAKRTERDYDNLMRAIESCRFARPCW